MLNYAILRRIGCAGKIPGIISKDFPQKRADKQQILSFKIHYDISVSLVISKLNIHANRIYDFIYISAINIKNYICRLCNLNFLEADIGKVFRLNVCLVVKEGYVNAGDEKRGKYAESGGDAPEVQGICLYAAYAANDPERA